MRRIYVIGWLPNCGAQLYSRLISEPGNGRTTWGTSFPFAQALRSGDRTLSANG